MITLVPGGGLANRMRVIDSGHTLSQLHNEPLNIIWLRNRDLNCRFKDLFSPSEHFIVKEFNYLDFYAYPAYLQRKSKIIQWLTKIDRSIRFDHIILNDDIYRKLKIQMENISISKTYNQLYLSTCLRFRSENNLKKLFEPKREIENKVNIITKRFNKNTIGLHIRQADNTRAIMESPLHMFEQKIERHINEKGVINFFLATDSVDIKEYLHKKFKDKIITNDHKMSRSSKEGIQNALIDFLCLSKTNKIYGSSGSTFTMEASAYGHIPLELVIQT